MSVEIRHRNGGVTIVHDLSALGDIIAADRKFNAGCDAFHAKLMALGVKAYRCNDGWVDREKHIVTFFSDERTPGYYWGNQKLKCGDKIFLRDTNNGGKFAYVDYKVENCISGIRYHYILSGEVMDAKGNISNPELQASIRQTKWLKLFRNIIKRTVTWIKKL